MNQDWFNKWFVPRRPPTQQPVASGLYHYMVKTSDEKFSRFHLRVEPGEAGMLVCNATAAARLSPVGVLIAKGLLEGKPDHQILESLASQYKGATKFQREADLWQMKDLLKTLAEPGDIYPIANLEDAAVAPRVEAQGELLAPLQADVQLAEPERTLPILKKLWQAGVLHSTLVVSQKSEPDYLVKAVEEAEQMGMICGVRARASDLDQGTLVEDLVQAGVDYVTIYFASANFHLHDKYFGENDHLKAEEIFKKTQELEVADVGHVPLISETLPGLGQTLAALLALNVPNAAFYAIASPESSIGGLSSAQPSTSTTAEAQFPAASRRTGDGAISREGMRQVASIVEEESNEALVRYLWEPPLQRNPAISLVQQVRKGPRCSSDLSIRVEADGNVIPPRGPYQSAGNLFHDSWETIWSNPVFRRFRERVQAPTRCEICPGMAICAADCPAEPQSWAQDDF